MKWFTKCRKWSLGLTLAILLGAGVIVILKLGHAGSIGKCSSDYPDLGISETKGVNYFPPDYRDSETRFTALAKKAGADTERYQNPMLGEDGMAIFTDVAYFGPKNAHNLLILSSGTHGVEAFAGAGIQIGLLEDDYPSKHLPQGVGLLMIHAINPYGMSHRRRYTEENIDLNRNFPDAGATLETDPIYAQLADVVAPDSVSFWSEVSSWGRIKWAQTQYGDRAKEAIQKGQYHFPKGLFFGGKTPAWAHTNLLTILGKYAGNAKRVVMVDVHTGLGSYGHSEILLNVPESDAAYVRAKRIWASRSISTSFKVNTEKESDFGPQLDASLKLGVSRFLESRGISNVTAVSLEFGTRSLTEVFKALRAEGWLHHHGSSGVTQSDAIKECLLRAFYPDSDQWKSKVWKDGQGVVDDAVKWLGQ